MKTVKQVKKYIILKEERAKLLLNNNVRTNVTLRHARLTIVAVKIQ
jgi:hypothetical protein